MLLLTLNVYVDQEFNIFLLLSPINHLFTYNLLGLSEPSNTKTSSLVDTANLKIFTGISLGTCIVMFAASFIAAFSCVIYSLTPANCPLSVK